MTREQELENLLAECYGAWLEVGLVTPPAQMSRGLQTFLYHMPKKMEEAGIKPWAVKFVETAGPVQP